MKKYSIHLEWMGIVEAENLPEAKDKAVEFARREGDFDTRKRVYCPECGQELESLDLQVEGWKQLEAFKNEHCSVEEKYFNEKNDKDSATAECPHCKTILIRTRGEEDLIEKAEAYLGK